jgi:hypothetical protein
VANTNKPGILVSVVEAGLTAVESNNRIVVRTLAGHKELKHVLSTPSWIFLWKMV